MTRNSRYMALMAVFGISACLGFLVYKAQYDPGIHYLPEDARAFWITGSGDIHLRARTGPQTAVFTRSFQAQKENSAVVASIRAFKVFALSVNDRRIPIQLQQGPRGWKEEQTVDVSPYLRPGGNTIAVTVINDYGTPALWLAMEGSADHVKTDPTWDVATGGAGFRKALIAGKDFTYPAEAANISPREAVLAKLPVIAVLFAVSAGIFLLYHYAAQGGSAGAAFIPALTPRNVLIVAVTVPVLWFIHNSPLLDLRYGFDAPGHLEYVQFLLENERLPKPHEGWSMYHPPLFYLLSALLYGASKFFLTAGAAVFSLRLIPFLSSLSQIFLTYVAARLLFPHSPKRRSLAVLMAALIPMNIYQSYYFSNEGFLAFWIGLSLVITLSLIDKPASWPRYLALGLVSGAALLTKVSALPFILLSLYIVVCNDIFIKKEGAPLSLLRAGVVGLVIIVIAGWFYVRNLSLYGKLLIGNWEPALGLSWWQDPGYRTIDYYVRFGDVLSRPYFAGIYSFFGSLYSTFWGDGFYGGVISLAVAPPWDYVSMSTLYIIAVPAAVFMAWGFISMAREGMARDHYGLLLFCGAVVVYLLFMLYVTLTAPMYASGKAFYGLSLIAPYSLAFAWGFESADSWCAARGKAAPRLLLYGWLGIFIITVWSTFYIAKSH